jgi:hypothetical protein
MQLPLLVRLPQQLLPPPLPLLQVAVHPVDLVLLVDLVKVVPLRPLMPLTRDIPTVVVDGGITGRFGRKSG